jgi:predicted ATP-dependent endonuclease of OLD family
MIIATIVRNLKTYVGINYVPITYGQSFCGLVGNNGIGKSSVLEALDSFFNSRPWNFNVVTKKSGFTTTRPHIVPVFMVTIDGNKLDNYDLAKRYSDYVWELEEADIHSQNRDQFKTFSEQLSIIKREHTKETTLILPIGYSYDNVPNLSLFNTKKLVELFNLEYDKSIQQIQDEDLKQFEPLILELKNQFEYIYIPKDIDPENFTQLETKEIQSLMGETLTEIVEKCVPQGKIQEINKTEINN